MNQLKLNKDVKSHIREFLMPTKQQMMKLKSECLTEFHKMIYWADCEPYIFLLQSTRCDLCESYTYIRESFCDYPLCQKCNLDRLIGEDDNEWFSIGESDEEECETSKKHKVNTIDNYFRSC